VDTWHALEHSRREVVDELMAREAWLDLRLIGALGEPASWRLDSRGQPRPDDGASRLELQPRNSGATFVANRLRRLAQTVSGRDPAAIIDGLTGRRVEDEAAENRPNSRTATGLAGPGPTDNAVAWCALWGISQLPVAHQVLSPSRTAGHVNASRVGDPRHGWLCLPVPERPVPVPRLRTILASAQLISAVPAQTEDARPAQEALHAERVRAWLLARGVGAVVRFPIEEFGSGNASERRVLAGEVWPLRREPPRR
jgi:CRISPR-associated protein Csb3